QHSVRLQASERTSNEIRQNADCNPASIQRRQGEHVEHGKNRVYHQATFQHLEYPLTCGCWRQADKVERRRSQYCQQYVRRWPGHGNPRHISARVAQCCEVYGHRFGIAEYERGLRKNEKRRQQDSAEWIDVLERIQAYSAQARGGVVSKKS